MSGAWTATANPEKFIRPQDQVFNMAYERPSDDPGLGERLEKEYKIAGVESARPAARLPPVSGSR